MSTAVSELKIRWANSSDTSTILSFIKELADFEKLSHEVVATESSLKETLFQTERKTAEVLIAEWDQKPVGFALFFHNFSTFLGRPGIYLEDLYITPSMRSKGIGEAMLSHIAQIAVDRKCGRLEWSVLDWNENAIRFYQRLGATPMSDWTQYRLTGQALQKLASTSN
jgi:GNAT superfamily N-acetyltransferase